jgi:hypothetical protein
VEILAGQLINLNASATNIAVQDAVELKLESMSVLFVSDWLSTV